jgi:CRISPR-associated protein Cmr4
MTQKNEKREKLLMMLAETPVHAGSGSELGAVDLPIQRERHTELPTVHGSGVKGVLRAVATQAHDEDTVTTLFGPEPDAGRGGEDAELAASAIAVGDARLVLFPVRTVGPAFAWVTAPYCLARLKRDLKRVDPDLAGRLTVPAVEADQALVTKAFSEKVVVLEDYELEKKADSEMSGLAKVLDALLPDRDGALAFWKDLLPSALVVVSDDLLRDFCRHATEVVTRVRLDPEKKTVQKGALWTEEYLPADSLLYSVLQLDYTRVQDIASPWSVINDTLAGVIQVGGKETIGRGLMRAELRPGSISQAAKKEEQS